MKPTSRATPLERNDPIYPHLGHHTVCGSSSVSHTTLCILILTTLLPRLSNEASFFYQKRYKVPEKNISGFFIPFLTI